MRQWPCLVAFAAIIGCSSNSDNSASKYGVFTTLNNHRITTWVNDEPVLVCDNVWNGYNKPLWHVFRKGENAVHFTAERLPKDVTEVIRENDPADPGHTVVKIGTGSPFSPKVIATWTTREDRETSPTWPLRSNVSFRPALDAYDSIQSIDQATKEQISQFLTQLQKALDAKDVSSLGLTTADFSALIAEVGMKGSLERDVFGAEPDAARVSKWDELDMIHGKKTIMVYRPDGEQVFVAGIAPDAPRENGKLYLSLSSDALYFVKQDGKLKPLWSKKS